ncbi:phosphoacetylglucosamine mutase [Plakobranchus ocellatus]|uniref:phosphoacetylglucosamine mutase n=1 Tax=Plakobranchus ocellatus TaxID=259542 RepID=A0AAV4DCV3_9GAST|nr:phosphoacetylglucosamine mutase [Plakobranchus ocellatus]
MDLLEKAVETGRKKYPRSLQNTVSYGTAGIRMRAENLDFILYRMGLLSVLFSKFRKGQVTGLMVTASHNPAEDNGVKIIDTMGEMMPIAWEKHATDLTNASDDKLGFALEEMIKHEGIDLSISATVCTAMDTRPSSVQLLKAATDGIKALKGLCLNYGLLTTPQLHYMVCCRNTKDQYGLSTEAGYYSKLTSAFLKINKELKTNKYSPEFLDENSRHAAVQLATTMNMINQTVGDAISDMLLVETILASRDWTCEDWDSAYTDLPSRMLKIKVEDRNIVKTTDAERRTTSPPGLQEAIDQLVAGYKFGRAFVRPSGTEDVMRVYAEADTRENADKLAYEVGLQVYDLARGIGDKPVPPV